MKWEYYVRRFVPEKNSKMSPLAQLNEHLNDSGKNGWELISTVYNYDEDIRWHTWELVFKRPLLLESDAT